MQTLNLPMDELQKFASDVLERFENPFVDHQDVLQVLVDNYGIRPISTPEADLAQIMG